MKKQKKPLSKGAKVVIILILVAAVAVLGVSIYKLVGINQSYQEANDLYDDIAALVMSEEPESEGQEPEEQKSGEQEPEEQGKAEAEGTQADESKAADAGAEATNVGDAEGTNVVDTGTETPKAADAAALNESVASVEEESVAANAASDMAAVDLLSDETASDAQSISEAEAKMAEANTDANADAVGAGDAAAGDLVTSDVAAGEAAVSDSVIESVGDTDIESEPALAAGVNDQQDTDVTDEISTEGESAVSGPSEDETIEAVQTEGEPINGEPAAAVTAESTDEVGEDLSAAGAFTESAAGDVAAPAGDVPILTEEFSDSSMFVFGGRRWADPERLQRYADAASEKKELTAFSGIGKASMAWNFKALHGKYPDSVGWIYQKDEMSYPIVMGKDNNQYLRNMIDGKYNVAGTLFVDCEYKDALSGRYSVVYGHNMDDRSMFGSLTDYKDEKYYLEHPYFEIYVGDQMYRYHVYAAMKVDEDSDLLMAEDQMTDEEFLKLMKWVDEEKPYGTKAPKITKNSDVIVLATCTEYPRNYAYRNVVVLVREKPLVEK